MSQVTGGGIGGVSGSHNPAKSSISAGGGLSADQELRRLKEAIVDLYLAIKIRSTEEVSSHHPLLLYYYLSMILSIFHKHACSWTRLTRDTWTPRRKS